jgi:hypothetical protein
VEKISKLENIKDTYIKEMMKENPEMTNGQVQERLKNAEADTKNIRNILFEYSKERARDFENDTIFQTKQKIMNMLYTSGLNKEHRANLMAMAILVVVLAMSKPVILWNQNSYLVSTEIEKILLMMQNTAIQDISWYVLAKNNCE